MKFASTLLAASALCGLAAPGAYAATAHRPRHHAAAHHHTAPAVQPVITHDPQVAEEMARLRAQVTALQERLDATQQAQATTSQQVAQTQSQVGALSQSVAEAPKVASTTAKAEVASAFDHERKQGYFDFKGVRITPGGFLEFAGVERQHFQGNDIASSFSIPFPNNYPSHVGESRFTARQSRLSLLVQGNPNDHTVLTMYGEFDFQGGAQTANSNESNSYNPRIRHLYAAVDWTHDGGGVHLLAGQNWSLLTMNAQGISPRNEVIPAVIDAQYVPGFVWTRQPQIRLAIDTADHHLWAAVSAENAATTVAGTVPADLTYNAPAGSGFDSTNSLSLNKMPDFIGKVAYEGDIAGHKLHIEGFGISRNFTAHVDGAQNVSKGGYGFGGGITLQAVPALLDLQFSGIGGKGIGRYGSTQLPDVAFAADGTIHPVRELMLLGGATLHPTKMLDVYVYAGKEQEFAESLGGNYGIGLLTANNAGCEIQGGTCNGNTRRIEQLTGGFWQKIYSGSFGRAQVGLQYAYTERELFVDANGNMPTAHQNVGIISFRYYPF